jgi:O-antigen/teichoic acid export membrane protein
MRCVLLLIPFAAVMAASAGEIVGLLFGDQYLHSTQVFQYLIFAGVGNVAVSIGAAILTGAGRPSWTLWISAPLPAVAIVAHAWAIPRYGPSGAAFVTAVCATGGALVGFVAIQRFWDATPPFATLIKSALIATAGAAVAASWSTPGLLVLLKLGALCTAFVVLMLVSGELDAAPVLSDLLPGLFQRSGPTDRIQDPLEPVGQYSAKTSSTSPTVTQASSAS